MTTITAPDMTTAMTDPAAYLLAAHKCFEDCATALDDSMESDKAAHSQIRKDILSGSTENPEIVELLTSLDDRCEIIAAADPNQALYIAQRLEELSTYFRKFSNYVVNVATIEANKSNAGPTNGAEELKEIQSKVRTEINAVMVMATAMGIEIPEGVPTNPPNGDAAPSYAGKLKRGGGRSTGRKAKASVLNFFDSEGNALHISSPRKVEAFIFQHLNPVLDEKVSSVSDLEEMLSVESIFDTPWELAGFTCERTAE